MRQAGTFLKNFVRPWTKGGSRGSNRQKGGSSVNDQEYWQGVEQCRERLWRIARMWLSDDSAAMDVVDEAVFRGWRACGRLRHPEYFTTWLTRILLNECSREKKRQDREQAVDQLPEQLRAVILLRYFFDCTLRETAELLRMPRSTVHTREKKALKLLKLELSEEV